MKLGHSQAEEMTGVVELGTKDKPVHLKGDHILLILN